VIVTVHVATGGLIGALVRSRAGAVALAFATHGLADRVPHRDIASRRFEIASGAAGVLLLAARHGPLGAPTLAAVAASIPDVEHVVRLPRPGGRKLYPSHRYHGWHRAGGVPAWLQLVGAGIVLGAVAAQRSRGV
jgi:hypothetical protein